MEQGGNHLREPDCVLSMTLAAGNNRVWMEFSWLEIWFPSWFLPTPLSNPPYPSSLASLWLSHLSQYVPTIMVDMASCTHPSVPLDEAYFRGSLSMLQIKFFPLVSYQNHSHCWESNLFHALIYHHYLQYKFWNQSRPGNFIDAQSGTEPRSPWISCAGVALLTTTNMSLTKLLEKGWLGKFSAEGNLSVTGAGYFYPYNSMLMKLVEIRFPLGSGGKQKALEWVCFQSNFSQYSHD